MNNRKRRLSSTNSSPLVLESLEDRRLLASTPIISEFLAKNDGGLRDGDGQSSDWIEIYNPSDEAVQLEGYHLTDAESNKTKWSFPSYELPPNEYLIVFASDPGSATYIDAGGFFHANFALRREGEYLALTDPQGTVLTEFGNADLKRFPTQRSNVSYGFAEPFDENNPSLGFFADPTPGVANETAIFTGLVDDTTFSVNRGIFSEPFEVQIATETSEAIIRFTTDGSVPTLETGVLYSAPISIESTTTLRAAAFGDNLISTNVDTQTYLFLDDVLTQDGAGLPETWGTFVFGSSEAPIGSAVPANYEVDPEVVNDPRYQATFKDDLQALPTLSLVMNSDDLWNAESGIYANTLEKGVAWERPVSVELFNPDGTTEFQIDAGIRMHGGFGRRPAATSKHSFRLFFKSEYGASKLEYPWFGNDQVDRFDTIVLRANYNYSWARGDRGGEQTGKDYTLITDRWAAEAQREMGGLPTNGTYVHLYVNGLYWGVYNPNERPDASFFAEHLGGDRADYDVIAHDGLVDGTIDAWDQLNLLARERDYDAIKQVVDMDNYIDYMILNQFGGNRDWPGNNWYASRKREEGAKWQFHSWDAEFFFIDLNHNQVSGGGASGPGNLFTRLRRDPEFQIDYSDRIYEHLFNDGVLTPERNSERLTRLAEPLDRAVVGESARWGDAWMNQVETARTRDDDWIPRLDELRNEYFPQRNAIVIEQFRRASVFPDLLPPTFRQPSDVIVEPIEFELTNPNENGTIFFTTNGEDPRLPGGETNPNATIYESSFTLTQGVSIRTRTLHEGVWSAIAEVDFFEQADIDRNGTLSASDIDHLCAQVLERNFDSSLDLNQDGQLDRSDLGVLINDLFKTTVGDSNLDGVFNSADLVAVFEAGEFEDAPKLNSTWETGDWNCDREFGSSDFVIAFVDGNYVADATATTRESPKSKANHADDLRLQIPDIWMRAQFDLERLGVNDDELKQNEIDWRTDSVHSIDPRRLQN